MAGITPSRWNLLRATGIGAMIAIGAVTHASNALAEDTPSSIPQVVRTALECSGLASNMGDTTEAVRLFDYAIDSWPGQSNVPHDSYSPIINHMIVRAGPGFMAGNLFRDAQDRMSDVVNYQIRTGPRPDGTLSEIFEALSEREYRRRNCHIIGAS